MAETQGIRCQITAVIVQYLPTKMDSVELLSLVAPNAIETDESTRTLFSRAYDVYERFSFEPTYREHREVLWLGRTHLDEIEEIPEVGSVTANHVLVNNGNDKPSALHQHIALSNDVTLDHIATPSTAAATRILHEMFWQENPRGDLTSWAIRIDPFHSLSREDGSGPFSRRAIYVSVLAPTRDASLSPDWRQVAAPLYGFLNLHAEGMNPATVQRSLEDCEYSSTDFYTGFILADAAVSIAVPYPRRGIVDPWPTPVPKNAEEAEAVLRCWNRRTEQAGDRFEDYDLSPEYPALRYNSMTLLEFAGNAVYDEWRVRGELDGAMGRPWPFGLISALTASRRIDKRYFKARSLDMIRIRAVRETAIRLVSTSEMQEPERAIEGLRASLTNGLLALLAVVAVLLTVVQIVIGLFGL
jgi:hypothetical protein